MPRRFLKLLLSTSFLIAALGQYNRVYAVDLTGEPTEEYGYLDVNKPGKYVFSYARVSGSKTEFAVGVITPTQAIAENGLVVPTAFCIDCKNMRGSFNFMQELPAENAEQLVMEAMEYQASFFCQNHKWFFKHSYW